MSNTIYSHQKSYTYLIKFIPTCQVYYGVRTANKVSPKDDLWKRYFTSSKIVKQLIEKYGMESFEFEIRRTFDNPEKARIWEENVLKRMKVVRDNKWLNRTDRRSFDHSEEALENLKQTCLKRYGVEYSSQSKRVKEKAKQTCLNKYGVPYTSQIKESREKMKQTCLEKYGFKNPAQVEEVKEKKIQTCLEKYNCENPVQSKVIKEKISQTMKKKYKCEQCDYISNQTWVTKHQKKTGHKGILAN